MPRRPIYRALRSTRLQLALTLAALLASAVLLLTMGLPPTRPLFSAVVDGDLEAIRRSLKWGANPNVQVFGVWRPLHWAAEMGLTDVARLLLIHGAHVNASHSEAPLNIDQMWTPIVVLDATPLHLAARRGHKNVVELLIAHGADVNAKDHGGMTPLALALQYDNQAVADLLRQHGAKE
jgi:ankyrin repeat protein